MNGQDGCARILGIALTIIAVVAMVIISVAGVKTMGFTGIFMGPFVILIAALFLGWVYGS